MGRFTCLRSRRSLAKRKKKDWLLLNWARQHYQQDVLAEHRIPEMPADLVPIIEKIWMEEIPGE